MGETTITIKKKDDTPQGQSRQQLARQGINGDTRLAHVNPYEEMLLKALGGVGTRNPRTGLKQFYTPNANFTNDIGSWYQNAFGREADPEGLAYWQEQDASNLTDDELWNRFYQAGNNETYSGWTPATAGNNNAFDIPDNLFPTSTSNSASTSTQNSGSQNTSNSQSYNVGNSNSLNTGLTKSSSSGSTYSGLPKNFQQQLLSAIIPELISQATNMEQNYDTYTNEALGAYQQAMNNAIRQNIPKAIASLANRGIINSTEGQGVLGNVYSSAAEDAATKGYTAAMQAALGKAGIPAVLAQIAALGQSSEGANQSSSLGTNYGTSTSSNIGTSNTTSQGTSFGNANSSSNSSSLQQNPLAPYEIMQNIINTLVTGG
jgi:hypothetical protein